MSKFRDKMREALKSEVAKYIENNMDEIIDELAEEIVENNHDDIDKVAKEKLEAEMGNELTDDIISDGFDDAVNG